MANYMLEINQRQILDRANELRKENSSIGLQEALVAAIKELTGASQVIPVTTLTRPASPVQKLKKKPQKKPIRPIPEHVKLNRDRVRRAEEMRRETGGVLPTVRFVSGGKVSPK